MTGERSEAALAPLAPDRLNSYLTTATIARSATESAGPALLVSAIAILGSAATGSYLVASLTASAAIAGPVIGAMVDRARSPKRAFALAMATMALGLTLLALFLGHVPFAIAMVLAIFAGLGYPAITGAWSAQLPNLVPEGRLRIAYSRDAATYSIAAVVAPPVATALIGIAATAPLWLPIALLLASIVGLRWVPLQPRAAVQPARSDTSSESGLEHVEELVEESATSLISDLKAGLSAMARRPALRRTIIVTTIGFAGTAAFFIAAPMLSKEFTGGLEFTSAILAAFAIGGLISALLVARYPVRRPDRAVIIYTILSGFTLALVGLAPTTPLLLVAAFAMGMTEPPLIGGMFQVRARESEGRVRAQVFTTAASMRMTAFALTSAACGALVAWGIWAVIVLGVLLHLAGLVVGIAFGPRLPHRSHRRHP